MPNKTTKYFYFRSKKFQFLVIYSPVSVNTPIIKNLEAAMSYLYINENGSSVSLESGYFIVKNKDNVVRKIPKETLESIGLFGNVSLTTPCIKECLNREIPICYFSSNGRYFENFDFTRI